MSLHYFVNYVQKIAKNRHAVELSEANSRARLSNSKTVTKNISSVMLLVSLGLLTTRCLQHLAKSIVFA